MNETGRDLVTSNAWQDALSIIDERRFWSMVEKTDGCWLWKGTLDASGYGTLWIQSAKRTVCAHRVSYRINVDKIGLGLLVCHSCENRNCVNPNHLWIGTPRESIDHTVAKRGHNFGGKRPLTKLTEKDAAVIRALYEGKRMKPKEIAGVFLVDVATVWDIIHRKTWSHECILA